MEQNAWSFFLLLLRFKFPEAGYRWYEQDGRTNKRNKKNLTCTSMEHPNQFLSDQAENHPNLH